MIEHKLIIAETYQIAHQWALANKWKLIPGMCFEHEDGSRMHYVHSKDTMAGRRRDTEVIVHDSWNNRPDRDELATEMLAKQMDVWHVGG